jgi:type I restriction enzyme S subunit
MLRFSTEENEKYITSVDVCIIRTTHSITSEYLMYMINTPTIRTKIWNERTGTTRARITRTKLGEFKVPLPSLDEQQLL